MLIKRIVLIGCIIITVLPKLIQAQNKPHIVFLINEDSLNYEAHKTVPRFASQLKREKYQVTVIKGSGESNAYRFPGLEVLNTADLLIIFCRRVALSHEQMSIIKNYLKEGKHVIGIRTANHAFSVASNVVSKGYEAWPEFVPEILGCLNRGYGPTEPGTDVNTVDYNANHPILNDLKTKNWHSVGNVYLVAPLLDKSATVLLTGKAGGQIQPIAWTRMVNKSKIFYTSLGYPTDFELPQFQQLLVNAINWTLD